MFRGILTVHTNTMFINVNFVVIFFVIHMNATPAHVNFRTLVFHMNIFLHILCLFSPGVFIRLCLFSLTVVLCQIHNTLCHYVPVFPELFFSPLCCRSCITFLIHIDHQKFIQRDLIQSGKGNQIVRIRRCFSPLPFADCLSADPQFLCQCLLRQIFFFTQAHQPACNFKIHQFLRSKT